MPEAVTEDREAESRLRAQVEALEWRLRKRDEQRRAMLHIMGDLNEVNRRLGDQRKAMLHILVDYEKDRSGLARQTERLDSSRRALLHILQDSHRSNLRLADSRKAMIHIMGDLRETTAEMQRREQEQLRLHEIEVTLDLGPEEPVVVGNPIQLEQVFINLLANARDAVADSLRKAIRISASVGSAAVEIAFVDTGHGIPSGLERRI